MLLAQEERNAEFRQEQDSRGMSVKRKRAGGIINLHLIVLATRDESFD